MRSLKESILSTSKVGRFDKWNTFKREHAHPKTLGELQRIIDDAISIKGNNVDLNWIDVSEIDTMECLFYNTEFNGDISKWDVSHVKRMPYMFNNCPFNGDISEWDVRKGNYMRGMFRGSPLEKDPPKWYKK
jgi:hypothetical protein